MLEAIVRETGVNPDASVIWLHGLGADGHDFADIIPALGLPADMPIRFVFPHAPVRPVSLNQGMAMRAWYDIYGIGREYRQDEPGIRKSSLAVQELITHERAQGIGADRIILAGFSQGGSMALYAGLRYPERLAGLLALSAWLPLSEKTASEVQAPAMAVPVMMMHGREDPVVDIGLGRKSYQCLMELGIPAQWCEYDMPHTVTLPQLGDMGIWLQQRLAQNVEI